MLVLTRKLQEKIRIGENIVITVLRTKGKAVRLGIEAPPEVPVIRGELAFGERSLAEHPQSDGAADENPGPESAEFGPSGSHAGRAGSAWPAIAEPTRQKSRLPGSPSVQVTLERVPRAQPGRVLPRSSSAAGPLRAVLDRRSLRA